MQRKGSNQRLSNCSMLLRSRISSLMLSMFATIASFYVAGRLWQDAQNRVYIINELDRITGQGRTAISVDDSLKVIACREQQKKLSALHMELAAAREEGYISKYHGVENAKPKKRPLVVVGILTSFGSKNKRDAIRRAWMGKGAALKKMEIEKGIVARFVIGRSENHGDNLDLEIDIENRQNNDFIVLARLNEIITSGVTTSHSNGSPEYPWMVDGAGLPPNASEYLPKLVELTRKVTEQVRLLAKDEDEKLAETSPYDIFPPYDQAKALGKTNIDVDRITAGLPCGNEGFLLMYARWRKLARDLYNERKTRYDITQIPDVYDSCKYDLLHNAHLNLEGLDELFNVAKLLADGVIPNEYGINPKQKLKIGSKIARRLLGKILIDLRNTWEEAINVAELKSSDAQDTKSGKKKDANPRSKTQTKNEDTRKSSAASDISIDQEDDDEKETEYRLDPKYANVKTPERHVKTRLYFTSESHIHSLMNVLRYCNLDESLQGEEGIVSLSALERLLNTKELDYMSYIVLRMFENTEVTQDDPKRFRIELTFSRGADLSPLENKDSEANWLHQEHTLPIMGPERLQEVGSCLTLEKMEDMFRPFAMPAEDFPPPITPIGFTGYFSKSTVLERLVNFWPFNKHTTANGK